MQLKASLSTGETLGWELPEQFPGWLALQSSQEFQKSIRSLGLVTDGRHHALPSPSAFRRVTYLVEVIRKNGSPSAATVGYVADNVMVKLIVYFDSHMSKVTVRRVGKARWINNGRARSWHTQQ